MGACSSKKKLYIKSTISHQFETDGLKFHISNSFSPKYDNELIYVLSSGEENSFDISQQ